MLTSQRLAIFLTYAGTLPFIIGVGALLLGINDLDIHVAITAYGAVILSFICGIHWGWFLLRPEDCRYNLFISSNIFALLAWLSLLLYPHAITTLLQMGCFLTLLWFDHGLYRQGAMQPWFYQLRRNATIIVVLALSAIMVL